MDVQVGTVDIHALQLPADVRVVNIVLICALVVYIVTTLRAANVVMRPLPLLHGETEL
jgi:uncharacterized membrane protein (UPF0182 family)